MDRVGLLIQGPMISKGRTGADPYDPTIVEVDTLPDVQASIDEARTAGFGPIVLSTWKGQAGTAEAEGLRGLDRLLALADPIPCPAYDVQEPKDNRIRQTFGCLEGMRAIGALADAPFAARMRTDQRLDLRRLIDETRRSLPGELRVLGLRRGRLAHLQDFVMAGTRADVVAHYAGHASCDFHAFHRDHHYDMFLKDAYGQMKAEIDPAAFFPRTYYLLDVQVPMFRHMLGKRLRPMSTALAASAVWRGRPFSAEYLRSRMVLEEDWTEAARGAALGALAGRSVKLTRFNRAYFVDTERMRRAGLGDAAPCGPLVRMACKTRVRLVPPALWS